MTVNDRQRSATPATGLTALEGLPRPVALVLSGGGVCGAAQVGAAHVLERRGFEPDMIVGTSVGALNGVVAAAWPREAASRLDHMWTGLRRRDVFPFNRGRSRASIFDDRGLRSLIARAGLPSEIEQLAVRFTAVAMDLDTGAEVLLERGDLQSALLASAAIPGILPPVERGGMHLVDGAVVACVPVRAALAQGAASVVVLSAGPETLPAPSPLPLSRAGAIAARAGSMRTHRQIEGDLQQAAQRIPVVVLPTGTDTWPAPWEFGRSRRLITSAAIAAGIFIDGLEISGPGLYWEGPLSQMGCPALAASTEYRS
jgi:NTE family protein